MHDPNTGERICEVCKQPFANKYTRYDTKTCSPKCRQQAYRNRKAAALEDHYQQIQADRAEERERRDRYNANRKKARAKRRRARAKS